MKRFAHYTVMVVSFFGQSVSVRIKTPAHPDATEAYRTFRKAHRRTMEDLYDDAKEAQEKEERLEQAVDRFFESVFCGFVEGTEMGEDGDEGIAAAAEAPAMNPDDCRAQAAEVPHDSRFVVALNCLNGTTVRGIALKN